MKISYKNKIKQKKRNNSWNYFASIESKINFEIC